MKTCRHTYRTVLSTFAALAGLADRYAVFAETDSPRAGFIRKTRDLDRKNMIRVTITEKGWQSYNDLMRLESVHRMMSCLSKEERQQLRSYLERLRSEALKPPTMNIRQMPFP